MNRAALAVLAAILLPAAARAATGTLKTYDPKYNSGAIVPDAGGKEVQGHPFGVDPSRLKAGLKVQYQDQWIFGVHSANITGIVDAGAKPAPAPAPAPAPQPQASSPSAAALPTAVVKTWDPASKRGTMAPTAGGRDLSFALAPDAKVDVKVGGKVSYVEAFVTAPAP